MKLLIKQLVRLVLCGCFANVAASALPVTNEEPSHILIEAVILSVTKNLAAGSLPSAGSRVAVPANFYLGEAVSWFTNVYPVIGQQNGIQYVAKFRDELNLTMAALVNDCPMDVVQRPRILTSAGKAAQFFVAKPRTTVIYNDSPAFWAGLELDVTPEFAPESSQLINIRCEASTTMGLTNIANVGVVPFISPATNSMSITVRDGEIFMVVCAMDPLPEQTSTFRKSIHAIGSLFGRPTRPQNKEEVIILFRAKQIANIKWDERGRPVF